MVAPGAWITEISDLLDLSTSHPGAQLRITDIDGHYQPGGARVNSRTPTHESPLLVLYGSKMGAPKDIARQLGDQATQRGYRHRPAARRRGLAGDQL